MDIFQVESLGVPSHVTEEDSKSTIQEPYSQKKTNSAQILRVNARKTLGEYLFPSTTLTHATDSEHGCNQLILPNDPPLLSDVVDALYILFPEIYRKRREASTKEQSLPGSTALAILPHKLPLKRRLADHKWRDFSKKDKRFVYGVNCIDKFKDISAALIVKLYQNGVMLGGQDQSQVDNSLIVPYSNPLVQELLEWIDKGFLHTSLMQIAIAAQVPFYDGGIVVEVQDFRDAPEITMSALRYHNPTDQNINKHSTFTRNSQHNSHRLFLKPNEATLHADLMILLNEAYGENSWNDIQYLDMEQKLRSTLCNIPQGNVICLNPSPYVTHLMNFFHYQKRDKQIRGAWTRAWMYRKIEKAGHKKDETNAVDAESYQFVYIQKILDFRRSKLILESEPFPGLDSKKHLFPARRSANWDIPLQRIYRTVKMERENPSMTFSLHILVGLDGSPEVVLSIGESQYHRRMMKWMYHLAVNLNGLDSQENNRTTTCFKLTRPQLIEPYIQSFKVLTSIQDTRIKCVADLTNPSAWNLFNHFKS